MQTLLERERELAAVDGLLERGGVVLLEGKAGIGKTALVEEACRRAGGLGRDVLRARGSDLETAFAFGVVRQLFERRLASAPESERDELLAGPAGAIRPLLFGGPTESSAFDTSFAVLHGLYWLAVNLADRRRLLIAVDDAHWADAASLRGLAHLAPRLDGPAVALLLALRPVPSAPAGDVLEVLLGEAQAVVRPDLLSEAAVGKIVRATLGDGIADDVCAAAWATSGGNPFYLSELLRAAQLDGRPLTKLDLAALLAGARGGLARRVLAGVRRVDPRALGLARALAVLGDGCALRHAASIAGLEMPVAIALAAGLVRAEVLAGDDPPWFIHPVVREAVHGALGSDESDALHRSAARLLHADGARPGQVASHLVSLRPAGDDWALNRLCEAGRAAAQSGAPAAAAVLFDRALAEPPPPGQRIDLLREAARAHVSAGSEAACARLEEALGLLTDPRDRAEIVLELGEVYAALFRWIDSIDLIERTLQQLGDADEALTARLESQLVVGGLLDARGGSRVAPVLERLSSRSLPGGAAEAFAFARGTAMLRAGRPAQEAAAPLEEALRRAQARTQGWDPRRPGVASSDRLRAALLWSLVAVERFGAVEAALVRMVAEVQRSGSARGLVAVYSTLGLLRLRLGALPEADAAARVALRVLQEGDFASGLALAATVLADVAVEAGALDEAQALVSLLPQHGWSPGVLNALIPATRGRLRLAQGNPAEALVDFQTCTAMFSGAVWGMETRDVGFLHARSGAALALLRLGEREAARRMAQAELADVRVFGAPRALGVALRVAGLTEGGEHGIDLLHESVASLKSSPASLELAHSLTELGAALRRAGQRRSASEPLAEAQELAVRCGARRLAARAREELKAIGARPRRPWRTGVEALTPSELRIVRLASDGHTNREIAQELYVTLKTVEGHLSRAYTKLGIDGRADLPGLLEEEKTRVGTL